MSEATGFVRWAQLMDRKARDEELTSEEEAFCLRYAVDHEACQLELEAYDQLGDLDVQPDEESRALVDSALRRLEAEDAERAVAEVRLLRRPRVPVWLAVSAVSAAAAVLLGFGLRGGQESHETQSGPRALTRAELVYASGDVQVGAQGAAAARTLLSEGATIETRQGVACVLIDSDINLCLAANSGMRLSALHAPARRVELLAGVLATRLSTQPEGMSLTIEAGSVKSTAVGTAFSVERAATGPVVTTVMNGKVRVSDGGTARLVNAHERATSAAARVDVNAVSRSEEAASWALLGPTMLWHDPVSGVLELNGDSGKAEASLDGQSLGQAPLMSLVPVGSHRLVVRNESGVLLDETLHWNAGESRTVRYTQPVRTPPVMPAAPTEPKPRRRAATPAVVKSSEPVAAVAKTLDEVPVSDALAMPSAAELLRSARSLMREGRMRPAAEAYEALRRTYPHSEEAHTVLVSLGQLQLAGLHNPGRALALLDAYLARGGTLSEEARVTRIHALRELGRESDEADAIREFLSKHPRSFEAVSLRDRLAALRAAE